MGRPRTFDDNEVIDRAMETFWTHGYAETSPSMLVEATGVAKGSLYNAFGSKRALFDRALARYDRMGAESVERLLSGPGTTHEVFRAFLRGLVDADLANERRGCLNVNTTVELAHHDPAIARAMLRAQERTLGVIAARIDRGRRDGDVDPDLDVQATTDLLGAVISGLRVLIRIHDATRLHRVIDAALTCL
ncbi:TetR/AcrR family transcriptional regulator [Amycolatopsis eburnea]|uniref:TetR/AcrR family transcriptional regulator n=1 Tax=Amycolatopsis eburnea TaxID=2267691 RepID=A0A3R9F7Q9_9PSEU|nr:TetR/AcrR family transcriptional regulator [Amycolatopsis eburnea]RSD14794.1 TetR/AcrR family transcriptional regulator [Amycolatopsis eburnea]